MKLGLFCTIEEARGSPKPFEPCIDRRRLAVAQADDGMVSVTFSHVIQNTNITPRRQPKSPLFVGAGHRAGPPHANTVAPFGSPDPTPANAGHDPVQKQN